MNGQEVVIGLQSNRIQKNLRAQDIKSCKGDTISLPFFDDFSGNRTVPDPEKWCDNYVFINDTYTNDQITTGVATFDALDNTGRLYDTASSARFEADRLTSRPVNLDFQPTDNIWLSFYYQPGGLADVPEENDSLTLQFYAPAEEKWYSVWRAKGGSYHNFKAAIIKIDQPRFLQKGFMFRFKNYVTLSSDLSNPSLIGNCDIWNIDYVLLDKNRNSGDTIFHDVAFRKPIRSLLKTHESMPWKQFKKIYLQEMRSYIPVHFRNNDTIVRNITRDFDIWDVYKNTLVKQFSAGAVNIDPLTNNDSNVDLFYTFNTDYTDSALFKIKAWIITDVFDPKENDTLVYYQVFNNYFAFDDGSSEAGYGITGGGSRNARVACGFESYTEDTLRAISICFNDSYQNSNQRSFDLMVWGDDNGIPGNVLYTRENVMVEQGKSINGFYTYNLTEPIPVDGVFYIGWKQLTETFLNVGFDINTPPGGRQFYLINGVWEPSVENGTIMIRPIMGSPLKTSVNDVQYKSLKNLHFWPNPAKDCITIDQESIPVSGLNYISITDIQGRELIKAPCTGNIDLSSLHEGIYIVIMSNNGRPVAYSRLVKIM